MHQENPKGKIWPPLVQVGLDLHEFLGRMEGFEQLVGYKAEISEKQGFLHQFCHSFEGYAKESQADMTLTYQDLVLCSSSQIMIQTLIVIFQNCFPTQNLECSEILEQMNFQIEEYLVGIFLYF